MFLKCYSFSQIAVLAKFHGVPFFVAAPLTSIDLDTPSGDRIVIEERPAVEMTHVGGKQIAASGWIKFVSLFYQSI